MTPTGGTSTWLPSERWMRWAPGTSGGGCPVGVVNRTSTGPSPTFDIAWPNRRQSRAPCSSTSLRKRDVPGTASSSKNGGGGSNVAKRCGSTSRSGSSSRTPGVAGVFSFSASPSYRTVGDPSSGTNGL